jgi:uncharacterized protein (DUF302 family)
MIKVITFILFCFTYSTYASAMESMISVQSHYSVQETADRFESIIKGKGLTLFASIDHQQNATGVNLTLRATKVIIFGNPKVGTPLMQCSQKVAIDLPQKMLVWHDENNKVWLSYNNPDYISARHKIEGCDKVINKISNVLRALTKAAAAK